MTGFTQVFLLVVLVADAFAGSIDDSNRFVDDVLQTRLPKVQSNSVPLDDFKFKIKKELELGVLPTHRDIKANFTNGAVNGLNNLRKLDNCQPTVAISSGTLLSCKIDLSPLEVTYISFVKGFNIAGQVKEIPVTAKIVNSSISFEIQQNKNEHPFVKTFHADKVLMKVDVPDIGFNEERDTKFKNEVDKAVQPLLLKLFAGKFLDSLNAALEDRDLKLPQA